LITPTRQASFAQNKPPTWVDRFGEWLSQRKLAKWIPSDGNLDVADLGCGYYARQLRGLESRFKSAVLVDMFIAPEFKQNPKFKVVEGTMPEALEPLSTGSLDRILFNSVLEHLWEPQKTLHEIYRLLKPGGIAVVNVPNWRGKFFLEFAAFRLGLSPAEEMDDHKNYYDPKDLWPMLVAAGFRPRRIKISTHKFGLNTIAVVTK